MDVIFYIAFYKQSRKKDPSEIRRYIDDLLYIGIPFFNNWLVRYILLNFC